MTKIVYKALAPAGSALSGMLASVAFKQVWKRATGNPDAPNATDRKYGWRQVVIAAAMQGAIFGAVKAAVDRAGAVGYRNAAGKWPTE